MEETNTPNEITIDDDNRFKLVVLAAARAKQIEHSGILNQKKPSVTALNDLSQGLDQIELERSIIHSMQKNYKNPEIEISEEVYEELPFNPEDNKIEVEYLDLSEEENLEIAQLENENEFKV